MQNSAQGIRQLLTEHSALRQRMTELEATEAIQQATLAALQDTLEELGLVEAELRQELTELQAAQQAVEGERQQYQALFELAPDGYLVTDAKGIIHNANHAAAHLLGMSQEHLIGKPLSGFVAREALQTFSARLSVLGAALQTQPWKVRFHPPRGRPFVGELALAVRQGAQSTDRWYHWLLRDITAREQVEAELRVRVKQQAIVATLGLHALGGQALQTLLDTTANLVAQTLEAEYVQVLELLPDSQTLFLRAGAGWQAGYMGLPVVTGEEQSHVTHTLRTNAPIIIKDLGTDTRFQESSFFHTHGVVSGISVAISSPDGPYGVLGAYTTQRRIFTRDDGAFLQAVANVLAQDMARQRAEDERQHLEREAQRAEHFALLGRLAAGMSHEIRNPLGAVFLHTDLLEEELHEPSADSQAQITQSLTEIKANLTRMDERVQDYLSLVRVSFSELDVQDLGAVVQDWAAEAQELAAVRGVAVQIDGLTDLGQAAFHVSTLRRAVLNLVQNALDAMPQGGTLTLQGQGTATQVQLQVRDTGCGISAERLPQIFEPLYTTKPGGTGLGLYIVREIVAAHDGQVTAQSVVGQGTTFTLTLPREHRVSGSDRIGPSP